MANIFKNIILILILSAAIIMMIGIVFYDYIPNGVEVKDPNEYIADETTTKTLATIKEEKTELFGITSNGDNGNIETVIHAYSLDAGDLSVYKQSNSYVSGKADPFDDIPGNSNSGNTTAPNNSSSNNSVANNSNGNNSSNNTVKQDNDGTIFNSTSSK